MHTKMHRCYPAHFSTPYHRLIDNRTGILQTVIEHTFMAIGANTYIAPNTLISVPAIRSNRLQNDIPAPTRDRVGSGGVRTGLMPGSGAIRKAKPNDRASLSGTAHDNVWICVLRNVLQIDRPLTILLALHRKLIDLHQQAAARKLRTVADDIDTVNRVP